MDSSQHIVMYNGSCTLDISIFISLSQAPFAYHFLAIGNLVCSLTAITGNAIILLALRRCSSLHPSSKALLGLVALVFYYRKSTNSMFIVFFCLFLSTYLPFVFSLVVATAIGFSSFPQLFALDITSFLALLNSSLNPVVYCWRIKEIQREAKQLIRNSHSCYSIILGRFFQSRVMPLNTSQGVQPV